MVQYTGKIEEAYESLKVIRQTGVQVGLGTHIPEVIDYVESRGWDFDFYMSSVYQFGRPREFAQKVAGRWVEEGELLFDSDREKMLAIVKQASKPCLIFKVFRGGGRLCATPASRRAALELVFRYAKPSDAVVIGMFPKYQEQVEENCRLVIELSRPRETA